MNTNLKILLEGLNEVLENPEIIAEAMSSVIQLNLDEFNKKIDALYENNEYEELYKILSNGIIDFPMQYVYRLMRVDIGMKIGNLEHAEIDLNVVINRSQDQDQVKNCIELKKIILQAKDQ